MIADSNLFIYVTQPNYSYLIDWFKQNAPMASAITHVETLGYYRLQAKEKALLVQLFGYLGCLYPTPETFTTAIQLRQQRKISLGDAIIAATALEHRLTLVTRNVKDFEWIAGLKVINPIRESI